MNASETSHSGTGPPSSPRMVDELASYPTAMLSDALDELDVVGAIPGVAAMLPRQPRIAGTALPVRFVRREHDPDAHRFGGGVGRPLERVLQTMRLGEVVVMDLDGTTTASAWGGLASRLARQRGVRGTVLHGTCRDIDEIVDLAYPVWAAGVHPRRSRNEFTFGSIGQPVHIGPVSVGSGDIIVGDATGVVCVPHRLVEETLALARTIARQERQLVEQIDRDRLVDWDQV